MITDKLENISLYKNIPDEAIRFIKGLNANTEEKRYEISENCYANVESYTTKDEDIAKFEAHKNYIDIQILLSGTENIYYTDKNTLSVAIPYNEEKDIEFYSNSIKPYNFLTLDGLNFAMIFPHEAHAPQVKQSSTHQKVKKAVIKIKI
ncbi:MAG: YhcH/YjgK/YiaL family protein [Candidatus Gastranaerophilaceae bacterium]